MNIEIVKIDKKYVVRLKGNADFVYGSYATKKSAQRLEQKIIRMDTIHQCEQSEKAYRRYFYAKNDNHD